jgi:hypothetical protein
MACSKETSAKAEDLSQKDDTDRTPRPSVGEETAMDEDVRAKETSDSSSEEGIEEKRGTVGSLPPSVANKEKFEFLRLGEEAAFNYYYGYLKLILPSIATRVKPNPLGRLNPVVCVLLPRSCVCPGTLTEMLPSCTSEPSAGWVNPVTACRAGTVNRTYTYTVYKLVDNLHAKPRFLMIEYATPLIVLREMWLDKHISYETRDNAMQAFVDRLTSLLLNDETISDEDYYLYEINDTNTSSRRKFHADAIEEAFNLLAVQEEHPSLVCAEEPFDS